MACILGANTIGRCAELSLSGAYQGRNLFVQNPFAPDKNSFCTEQVFVNEVLVMQAIKASAYEIDLSSFKVEDPIRIRIVHKDGCEPKVLNPQVLRASNMPFQFVSFKVAKDAITWNATGDQADCIYFVEQYLNNNWLPIRTVYGKSNATGNAYSVAPNHVAGENKYRVKLQTKDAKVQYSSVEAYTSVQESVTFYPKSVIDKITLSKDVPYQVLTADGKVIKKGKGKEILLKEMKTGVYYLNIDNRTEKFFKK